MNAPVKPKEQATVTEFNIPHPPSVNSMFVNVRGKGRVKSKEYRKWIVSAGWEIRRQQNGNKHSGPVALSYTFGKPPGRWDMSNCIKAIEDLLVTLQIITDDNSAIIRQFEVRQAQVEGVLVEIRDYPNVVG